MRYDLVCIMQNGTTEFKKIDEFDLMPFKIGSGVIDSTNNFLFKRKKVYYISDIQPNFKNMFKMCIWVKRVSPNPFSLNNEGIVELATLHRQLMKSDNDIMLQTLWVA